MSEARWPYGPNTMAVRRFLQRLAALAPDERARAADAYAALEGTPRFARADRTLAAVTAAAGRGSERDAALRPLAQLLHAGPLPLGDGTESDEALAESAAAAVAMDAMAPAAVAAVLALVVRDVLPADALATLYAPFAELIPVARLD